MTTNEPAVVRMQTPESSWFVDSDEGQESDYSFDQYEIITSPNDFNVSTLSTFIESGVIIIPGFQRNFVWDLSRASKLIESIILGIPIPQIFLYEEARDRFLVIDGQQRLMSIYYFVRLRFPLLEKRAALRAIYASEGEIPEKVLHDDAYFSNFNLRLPSQVEGAHNPFNGLNYETLGDYKTTFDLRAIRSIVVKQSSPKNDQSSMYEIFDRLNTGGINLTPQEIRMSLYRSPFLDMLARVNVEPRWRNLLGTDELDLHMKDIEILLRGLAMLVHSDTYKPSLRRFLNGFALEARGFDQEQIESFQRLIEAFFEACGSLDKEDFPDATRSVPNISV